MSSDPSHPQIVEGETSAALLAELDTLLERMLALPVNHLGEPPVQPVRIEQEPRPDLPVVTVTEAMPEGIGPHEPFPAISAATDDLYRQAILHPPEEPEATRPPEPVAIRRDELPALEDLPPLPEPPRLEPPVRVLELPRPASVPNRSEPRTSELPPRTFASGSFFRSSMRPLEWCNITFDRATSPLGAMGRWLRQPAGRAFLGWTGVLLLLAAGGLALSDALGWTR